MTWSGTNNTTVFTISEITEVKISYVLYFVWALGGLQITTKSNLKDHFVDFQGIFLPYKSHDRSLNTRH